jgi:5,10-methylenetetrahydromethanopterin reductase
VSRREVGLAFQSDKRPGDYARLAAKAEGYGADVFTIYGDLRYQPPLPGLLEAAAATSRIRLGPTCLNPYTMHPYEIAGQVATLDLASSGRAYLGLARGSWLEGIGIEQARPITYLAEASAVVARLITGDRDGFEGEVFRLAPGVELRYERQRRRVPLLIGSWGPQTLALAGRVADEAKVGGSTNPDMVAVARRRIDAGITVPRTAGDVALAMGAVTVVDEDGAAARTLARRKVAMYLDVVAELDSTYRAPDEVLGAVRSQLGHGDSAAAGAAIPDEVLDRFAFSGTPKQVTDQALALFAAGADRVEFGTPHGLVPEVGIDLIGTRVFPALR